MGKEINAQWEVLEDGIAFSAARDEMSETVGFLGRQTTGML